MAVFPIRTFGDPVLRLPCAEVTEFDATLRKLAGDMLETMYDAPGVGLAANQVGVQKRMFVYDTGDGEGPKVIVNPAITDSRGEWEFEEGCLSVPGLHWTIVRPKEVHLTGYDLQGNEVSIEADEFLARVFQHELDHLDGVLMLERTDDASRKDALATLRQSI